jgi:hypothetical protein
MQGWRNSIGEVSLSGSQAKAWQASRREAPPLQTIKLPNLAVPRTCLNTRAASTTAR